MIKKVDSKNILADNERRSQLHAKPLNQSLAIAYSVAKQKNKKK